MKLFSSESLIVTKFPPIALAFASASDHEGPSTITYADSLNSLKGISAIP